MAGSACRVRPTTLMTSAKEVPDPDGNLLLFGSPLQEDPAEEPAVAATRCSGCR
jgi:hypothetical protein